jgi:peptide/nickel transport system substrate-binding protein
MILAVVALLTLLAQTAFAFGESPMLAELARKKELPPVEKRLPPTPVVVKPVEAPGVHGGTWRRAYLGISDLSAVRKILYEPLVRWTPEYGIHPNLAEKWTIENDGRAFTFSLVKGVNWSDGKPFTAEDILFYCEDIAFNKELTPSPPSWLAPAGKRPKVTQIDEFTIRFEFEEPNGLFLQQLACPHGMELVSKPKHYLKRFHKKYAKPEELGPLLKERNASSWEKLFNDVSSARTGPFTSAELPSLCAWVTEVPAPAKRFVMKRNPYYWKVDTKGNQLPYIDYLVHDLQAEPQTILLKAVAGEIDFQGKDLGGMQNSVLLMAGLQEGKYRLVPKISTASVGLLLAPNLNVQDPVLKQIFADPRFRKALSYAVNRGEINRIIYSGKGTPRQAAPLKESLYYSASYEKAFIEYDLTKAAALLNEMGLKQDKKGVRLMPDGRPLQLALDVVTAIQSWVDTAEIVASNLKALGIEAVVKSETRELFRHRTQSAAHEIALWPGDGGMECLLDPRWYFPFSSESLQAPLYAQWYQSRGARGEEPPAEIKEVMALYDQILVTADHDRQRELFAKILEANERNLWVIGLVSQPPDFYVVAPNMRNVPRTDFQSWMYPNPGPIHPEQFYFAPK